MEEVISTKPLWLLLYESEPHWACGSNYPQTPKTRILDNRGYVVSELALLSLCMLTGVCGAIIFYTMTYSPPPLVRLEFMKYLM